MDKLTEEEIMALKELAAIAPQLEALLGATSARTDMYDDYDDGADADDWLARQIVKNY